MIVFLAGGSELKRLPRRAEFQHGLFSFFSFSKGSYAWLKRRREKQRDKKGQAK